MKLRDDEPEVWCSTFCNHGHVMQTGRPIDHECYVIPPRLLRLERDAMSSDASEMTKMASESGWRRWCNAKGPTVRGRKRPAKARKQDNPPHHPTPSTEGPITPAQPPENSTHRQRIQAPAGQSKELRFAGYDLASGPDGLQVHRETFVPSFDGDHGADPIGEDENGVFKWRMVPSGDVVDFAERQRRLKQEK